MATSKRRLNKFRVTIALLPVILLICLPFVIPAIKRSSLAHRSGEPKHNTAAISKIGGGENLRQVFKFSVVPGGVRSPDELLAAAKRDPIVRGHYQDIDFDAVNAHHLDKDMRAYVSYRVGDKIYWTKNRVQLHRGELVLTDGAHLVRGRCGNRISFTPVISAPGPEPTDPQFDKEEPPTFPEAFGGTPIAFAAPEKDVPPMAAIVPPAVVGHDDPQVESFHSKHLLPFLIPVGAMIGSTIGKGPHGNGYVVPNPPLNPPGSNPPPSNPPVGSNPPASNPPGTNPPGSNPPGSNPPGSNPPGSNPPGSNPPGSNPPVSNPPPPPVGPPIGPPVTVAPEPSQYAWLLCAGLGWLALRSRRRNSGDAE